MWREDESMRLGILESFLFKGVACSYYFLGMDIFIIY